ncbi:MAG: PstS family phosphate ABC transporter substrate-binding protein, partial [Planctomycetales bacterium]|nr:PstS family phosphate ABC transporter substrate-binding protein [Planctomycetales bacterium]
CALAQDQVTVDPRLPDYRPVPGIAGGTLKTVGSDTMNNMLNLWTQEFKAIYPGIKPEVDGKGSSNALPALIAGQASFGPMSREPKKSEIEEFKAKFGYEPTILETSIDMLAVYVNKDNPLKGLTLPQVDAIFSSTRKQGHPDDIRTWGQLGLDGDWKNAPISLYGRNSASGTYGFFKEKVLSEGDYKTSVKEQPGSSTVVQGVAKEKFGMGYSGIGYKTADVNAIALAKDENSAMVDPTADNAYTGKYPLARFLLLSVNYKPGSDLDPLRREFLKFIYSKQGQTEVVKDGYFPVQAPIAKRMLSQVGIEN